MPVRSGPSPLLLAFVLLLAIGGCLSLKTATYIKRLSSSRLSYPVTSTVTVDSLQECAVQCMGGTHVAFNFKGHLTSSDSPICEILDAVQANFPSAMQTVANFSYYELYTPNTVLQTAAPTTVQSAAQTTTGTSAQTTAQTATQTTTQTSTQTSAPTTSQTSVQSTAQTTTASSLCQSNPCLYGGICQVINVNGTADFYCVNCPYPTGGKTCSDLICTNCFRFNGFVIYLLNSTQYSWESGRVACQTQGMDLVMLKDSFKNEFLRNTLLAMTDNGSPNYQNGYWIGLKLINNVWTYVDGTVLSSDFNGWLPDHPRGGTCGILLSSSYKLRWYDNNCDPVSAFPTWNYIAVCEESYSFLDAEAQQLCASNPCLNGGTCQPVLYSEVATTACVCPYPMGGATCADIICTNCMRYYQNVVYLFGNPSFSWPDARTTCQANGLDLVMVKDSNKGTAIRNWLTSVNSGVESPQIGYWIGASRDNPTTSFVYVDNSLVDDTVYSDWLSGRPLSGQCVVLMTGAVYGLHWYDDECEPTTVNPNWTYVATCESTYSFLA